MELWGGRFQEAPNELAARFGASIDVDRRLYRHDILGSMAHCRMLAQTGIIDRESANAILDGLVTILAEIESGDFSFRIDREDIHANVEGRLRDLIGDAAGRLHTARSRNDQVALDTRLWARDAAIDLVRGLIDFADALVVQARSHIDVPMPGYTHLQRAQPVLLSHHLLAYVEMVRRDIDRLRDAFRRIDVSPLGSGALAGVPYRIDRAAVARDLGFASVSRNSLDAVSDRDFVVEIVAACALGMVHLSRYCEEVVLWASTEFGFVSLSDGFSTGSSIMPQKKNPDSAELIRGKTGRVIGSLTALLVMLKGTPLTYNKDFQEDKAALFDAIDTFGSSLAVLAPMTRTATFRRDRLSSASSENFSLATDYADFLAERGVPFRRAHETVGRLVAHCIERGITLDRLSLDELHVFDAAFTAEAMTIRVDSAIDARDVPGGTASGRVVAAIEDAESALRDASNWVVEATSRRPRLEELRTLGG